MKHIESEDSEQMEELQMTEVQMKRFESYVNSFFGEREKNIEDEPEDDNYVVDFEEDILGVPNPEHDEWVEFLEKNAA